MAIVYQATNSVNGKRYIGVTNNTLEKRRYGHHYDARKGRNKIFSKALRKYGEAAFEWKILHDYLFPEDAVAAEVRFVEKLKPEYNMTFGGDGVRGLKMSETSRAKMSAAHTPERKAAYRAKVTGRKNTPAAIARMSASHAGKPNLKLRGHKPSAHVIEVARQTGLRHKEKFLERVKGVPKGTERRVICLNDGKEHESASAAARYYSVSRSALIEMCLGTASSRHVKGHQFQYVGSPPLRWAGKRREKLTLEQVKKIRGMLLTMTPREIGIEFSVSPATIYDAIAGRTWKGVADGTTV